MSSICQRQYQPRSGGAAAGADLDHPIQLTLLGGFTVDGWIPPFSPRSPWRIAAYLAVHGPSPRRRIAGLLWPEGSLEKAQASLRSGLWRLHTLRPGVIDAQRDYLALGESVTSDLESFMATVRHVLASDSCDPADSPRLIGAGELTPEWDDEWLDTQREELHLLRLRSLGVLAERLLAARRLEPAYQTALAELNADPLREIAHQRMIRLHLFQGDAAQARKQYETCVALLRTELDIRPSPHTADLLRGEGTREKGNEDYVR
jgi:DNA-binding SARP family transcriptional activator